MGGHTFTAAGFPDDTDRLISFQIKGDVIHSLQSTGIQLKVGFHIFNLQNVIIHTFYTLPICTDLPRP